MARSSSRCPGVPMELSWSALAETRNSGSGISGRRSRPLKFQYVLAPSNMGPLTVKGPSWCEEQPSGLDGRARPRGHHWILQDERPSVGPVGHQSSKSANWGLQVPRLHLWCVHAVLGRRKQDPLLGRQGVSRNSLVGVSLTNAAMATSATTNTKTTSSSSLPSIDQPTPSVALPSCPNAA